MTSSKNITKTVNKIIHQIPSIHFFHDHTNNFPILKNIEKFNHSRVTEVSKDGDLIHQGGGLVLGEAEPTLVNDLDCNWKNMIG